MVVQVLTLLAVESATTVFVGVAPPVVRLFFAQSEFQQQAHDYYFSENPTETWEGNWRYDAFLHAYVAGRLASYVGEPIAILMGNGRENYQSTWLGGNEADDQIIMDKINNSEAARLYANFSNSGLEYDEMNVPLAEDILSKIDDPYDDTFVKEPLLGDTGGRFFPSVVPDSDLLGELGALSLPDIAPGDFAPGVLSPGANWIPAFLLPGFVPDALVPWNIAPSTGSPLVLDLVGTGIDLTTFNAATTETFFDIDGDGFAEQTAWIGANMGLLARDLNENGVIDGVDELFGSPSIDGFALLATLDSNGDHVINQYDSAWSDLVVWVDANGDAVTQGGELQTLASLNIVSFDLAGVTASTSTVSGNPISHTSNYRLANGTTRTVADAWFVHDNVNSTYAEDYDLDVRALFMPTLRGFGELADLHIAMSQDEDLLELVQDFVTAWDISRFEDGAALDADVEEILFTWAGVESVSAGSRGGYIDARKLEFLEKFFGSDFVQNGVGPNPLIYAAQALEESWERLLHVMKAQLMVQAGGSEIFDGSISYNVRTGEFDGDLDLSQGAIDDLETAAPASGNPLRDYWEQVAEFIEFTKGFANLTSPENTMVSDALTGSGSIYAWDEVQYFSVPSWVGVADPYSNEDTLYGTSGTDTLNSGDDDDIIYGYAGNDTLTGGTGNDYVDGGDDNDTLYGGDGADEIYTGSGTNTAYGEAGDDEIYGGSGADTLDGGDGNDLLDGGDGADILKTGTGGNTAYGGDGNDIYWYQLGDDVYSEYGKSGTDTILMPGGFDSGDIAFYRSKPSTGGSYFNSLNISVAGAGTIELLSMFNGGRTLESYPIETLTFADTSTLSTSSFTSLTTYGSSGADAIDGILTSIEINDTIFGNGGDDDLKGWDGNDVLDGGDGNDVLQGYLGDDSFLASAGYDRINEGGGGGSDLIRVPAGFDAGDVSLLRLWGNSNDLLITIDGLGQIEVDQHFSSSSFQMETMDFNGSSAITLTSLSIETLGTTGNDTITGISSGASADDIIDGGLGNDSLQGDSGNDTYYFSVGTDSISESSGTDIVAFRQGISIGDISVYRDGSTNQSKNLVVEDQNGNKTTIIGHFSSSSAGAQIESIVFYDTTTWSVSSIEVETRGSSSADTIYAYSMGDASENDTIHTYAGNDIITAGDGNDAIYDGLGDDTIYGGVGNDTYYTGTGLDYISETSGGGTDRLHIVGGVTINDVAISDYGSDDTAIVINASVDEITISHFRFNSSYEVEFIRFDDGFDTELTTYGSWIKGTSGSDTVAGNSSDNTLIGYAGNDTITGGDGNDDAHGGAGTDSLDGGNGTDLLYGGDGTDTLYGKAGLDTMHGGAGADIFVMETASAFSNVDAIRDFSVSDGDVLDVTDILDLVYDPINDNIADFISFSESSGNTFVSVDRDGTAGVYSMAQIVKLEGLTGLASPATLETNGNLIAA